MNHTSTHQFPINPPWKPLLYRWVPLLAAGIIFSGLWVALAIALSIKKDVPLSYLTLDSASISRSAIYYGLLSTIGLMIWAATAAVTLVGAAILHEVNRPISRMLVAGGLLTIVMNFDDAFQIHTRMLPENAVMLTYVAYVSIFLFYFRNELLKTYFPLLGLALIGFAISSFIDLTIDFNSVTTFVEDVFKFTGIVLWFIYFSHVTITSVRLSLRKA